MNYFSNEQSTDQLSTQPPEHSNNLHNNKIYNPYFEADITEDSCNLAQHPVTIKMAEEQNITSLDSGVCLSDTSTQSHPLFSDLEERILKLQFTTNSLVSEDFSGSATTKVFNHERGKIQSLPADQPIKLSTPQQTPAHSLIENQPPTRIFRTFNLPQNSDGDT